MSTSNCRTTVVLVSRDIRQRHIDVTQTHRPPQSAPEEFDGIVANQPDRDTACHLPRHRDEVETNDAFDLRSEFLVHVDRGAHRMPAPRGILAPSCRPIVTGFLARLKVFQTGGRMVDSASNGVMARPTQSGQSPEPRSSWP